MLSWRFSALAAAGLTMLLPRAARADAPACKVKAPMTFLVTSGKTGGDGSAAKPFGSIADALKAAKIKNACHAIIDVGAGDYAEPLTIETPRVRIKSRAGQRAVVKGTIEHAAGGQLELVGVDLRGVARVAVKQTGGRLLMSNVVVSGTQVAADDSATGLGLSVSGGGEAVLRSCTFDGNAHNAIRAEGAGTRLWMQGGSVTKTSVHPLALPNKLADYDIGVGAVLVTSSATAFLSGVTIEDNAGTGILVQRNARVRLDRSNIRRTTNAAAGAGSFGIVARGDSTLDWVASSVSEAGSCGVVVERAAAAFEGGTISKVPVGTCISDPRGTSASCLQGPALSEVPTSARGLPAATAAEAIMCPAVNAVALPTWSS